MQGFLDEWSRVGLTTAAKQYLVASEQPAGSAAGPSLLRGRVQSITLSRWVSENDFTLLAKLDLRFRGDPGAFGQGANSRFVTCTRDSSTGRYRLYLATGP